MFLDFLAEQLLQGEDAFLLPSDLLDDHVQPQSLQLQPENIAAVAVPQVRLACCCGVVASGVPHAERRGLSPRI